MMCVLLLSTHKIHSFLFPLPIPHLIMLLVVLGVACIRHLRAPEYGMELLPFVVVLAITLLLQSLFSGPYFSARSAIPLAICLFSMMVCIQLVMGKGCGPLVWQVINLFNLFSAGCVIGQMVCYYLGIRLDHMGRISQWFFNAWEFVSAFRPCGTYAEPAMFAQPALLTLYHALFIRKSWPTALIISLALVLSTSALGLMGILILLATWGLNLDRLYGTARKTKWLLLALISGTALVLLVCALRRDVFVVERLFSGSSIGVRALRSVDLFLEMSPGEKLYGVGLQNQARYLNFYGISLAHDTYETTFGGNREYAGALGYILCTTGFLGLVAFVWPFYRAFTRGGFRAKVISFLLIYSTMFCAMVGHTILMLYILAVYATVDMERSGSFPSRSTAPTDPE